MRNKLMGWAALVAMLSGGAAQATILTFDEIPGTENIQTHLDYQGFTFTSTHMHFYGCAHAGYEDIAFNGTTKLGAEGDWGGPITMSRQDGGAFSLLSLDIAEFFNNGLYPDKPNADLLNLTATLLDGSQVSWDLVLDGINDGPFGTLEDFQHVVLPDLFVNVTELVFTGVRLAASNFGGFSIDNLEVGDPVSVPEPGTLGMMGMGLLAAAAARRRRSNAAGPR
jgi:hypothetical protein